MADDFFTDLGKTISKAGQAAAERTSSFIEAARLSSQISGELKEVQALLQKVGSVIARRYAAGEIELGEEEKGLLGEVASHKALILDLKGKLARAKGQKVCPNCEELIDADAAFCPKCGAPAPVKAPADETDVSDASPAAEEKGQEEAGSESGSEATEKEQPAASCASEEDENPSGEADAALENPEGGAEPGKQDEETSKDEVPGAEFTEVKDQTADETAAMDATFTTVDDAEKTERKESES